MSFVLGLAGPSRRIVSAGGRRRLSNPNRSIDARQLHPSSSRYQHARAKPNDQSTAPDTASVSSHDRGTGFSMMSDDIPSGKASSVWLKNDANSDSPSSTTRPDPGTNTSKGPVIQSNIPWQIPPAWKSKLDPNAPWRKSLLESRRRWLEQAGHQLTAVGLKLNEVTGYKEVERLKEVVNEKGESNLRSHHDHDHMAESVHVLMTYRRDPPQVVKRRREDGQRGIRTSRIYPRDLPIGCQFLTRT